MSFIIIEVCEPETIIGRYDSISAFINTGFGSIEFIVFWDYKSRNASSDIYPKPCYIFLYKFEDFFIGDTVYISDNEKFFLIFKKLCYILSKEGKWRISANYICFPEYLDTLWTSEVAISCKWCPHDISKVEFVILIDIEPSIDLQFVGRFLTIVVSGDQLLQPEMIEVHRKISEKMTLLRIITVTEDNFVSKVFLIVSEFSFYIRKLGIKFIIFVRSRLTEILTSSWSFGHKKGVLSG